MTTTTKAKTDHASKTLAGIMFMLLNALCVSFTVIISKDLTRSLHPNQVLFLYKIAVLIMIVPWCFIGGVKRNLKTKKLGFHVARSAFSVIGHLCFLTALASNMNPLDVTALTYLEPIILMVIGATYFKEKFTNSKLMMIALSFVGAMFITRPSLLTDGALPKLNMNYIYITLALIFWAMNNLTVKILGKTEHTKAQIFYVMTFSAIFSLPLALQEWHPLETWHIKYLAILGTFQLLHSIAFFKALKHADISIVMPFDYCRLLFTGLLAYLVLNQVPNQYSIIGYVFITLGGMIFVRQEAINYRRKNKKAKEEQEAILESEYEI